MSKPLALAGTRPAVPASTVDDVFALVRARGGRATSPRRAVLEVLFGSRRYLTAEEVASAVQSRAPDVHMSTIYRTLDELQQIGVVVHSHLGHGPAVYQFASSAHVYFVCERCGATIEAPSEVFSDLAKVVKARFEFSIDPVHFAMLGRCAACQEAPTAPR